MKKFLLTVLSLILITSLLCSCSNVKDVSEVATVNGEKILREEYEYYLLNTKQLILQNVGMSADNADFWKTTDIQGKKAGVFAKETALQDAIKYTLFAQEAKRLGISEKTDEARSQISKSKSMIIPYGIDAEAAESVATKVYLTVALIESI